MVFFHPSAVTCIAVSCILKGSQQTPSFAPQLHLTTPSTKSANASTKPPYPSRPTNAKPPTPSVHQTLANQTKPNRIPPIHIHTHTHTHTHKQQQTPRLQNPPKRTPQSPPQNSAQETKRVSRKKKKKDLRRLPGRGACLVTHKRKTGALRQSLRNDDDRQTDKAKAKAAARADVGGKGRVGSDGLVLVRCA